MEIKEIKTLLLGLTNKCNGRCIACWHSNAEPYKAHELPLDIYCQAREKLFRQIKVLDLAGGGEIFYYSHIGQVLQDSKKYGFRTVITSNFTALSQEHKELLKDIDAEFVVSLDGSYAQMQEFLRPNCNFNRVVENIAYFVKHRKPITIQVTVSNHNFYDMRNMLKLAEELKVNRIRFQPVQFLRGLDTPYRFNKPPKDMEFINEILREKFNVQYSIFLDYFSKPYTPFPGWCMWFYRMWNRYQRSPFCPNTKSAIKIQEDGKVLSCCLPESRVMGDLKQDTLEEIISNPRYDTMRKCCRCEVLSAHFSHCH